MGLFQAFGSGLKGLFGEGFADKAAIASALINGDGAAVAQIRAHQAASKKDANEAAMKQQVMLHAYQAAKARGLSNDDAIVIATQPDKYADVISAWSKPYDTGPEGGFRKDPLSGKTEAAPRWDGDGNLYGPNADASQAPQRLIKGLKPVVTQGYGSKVYGWDRQSPQGFVGSESGGSTFKPGEVVNGFRFKGGDDTDPNNWEKVGGPSPSGSGGFSDIGPYYRY